MNKPNDTLIKELKEDLQKLVQFKSIGTDSTYYQETKNCCSYVKSQLETRFPDVKEWTIGEDSHAVLLGKRIIEEGKPTVLFYGHYDVQPVEPIDLWESDPFELTQRGDNFYGRGANDNKGHLVYVLKALETFLSSDMCDKVNIKMLVEGEEESGSSVLYQLLEQEEFKKELKADHLLIVDVGMDSLDKPSILLGARGILCTEVKIRVSEIDAHSGEWGSVIDNPLRILSTMISKLKDDEGKILIPHFYDQIESYEGLDFQTDEEIIKSAKNSLGCRKFLSDFGFSLAQSVVIRPSCDVNGLWGGYTGKGFKTVIPAVANAKISFRLVKGQNPDKILKLFKTYFESLLPKGVEMEVFHHGGGKAIFSVANSKTIQLLQSSVEKVFKRKCQLSSCGGSIPVAYKVWEAAEGGIAFVGTGLPDDAIHAPNEKFSKQQLLFGYKIILQYLEDLSI